MVVMTVKYIRDLNKMQSKIYFKREKKISYNKMFSSNFTCI